MLKKFKNLFSSSKNHSQSYPESLQRVSREDHNIDERDISNAALKVISELQHNGYEAYLVGGGVRDLLLGLHPKDFDVATDATPEQVQRIFHRARIIGRRFKIVHVRIGREVIEVTTFRGSHEQKVSKKSKQQAVQNDKGILLRDNVYGDLKSDAYRRDFSVNALYYDPSSKDILDYTGGVEDLKQRQLKLIGDPEARYKEDPVRMLRALRFKAKLGFAIDTASEQPIRKHSDYLLEIPAARLFEEVLKLFLSGKAEELLNTLHEYRLLQHLFPGAAEVLSGDHKAYQDLLQIAAANTDARIASGKRVTPAFIFAAFLWPSLQQAQQTSGNSRSSEQERMFNAADDVVRLQQQRTSIPKRFLIPMREIWVLQLRLNKRDARRAYALLEHTRFRAAYDFLLLREQCGELEGSTLGQWWTEFQFADEDKQAELLKSVKTPNGRRKPRRKRKPKPSNND